MSKRPEQAKSNAALIDASTLRRVSADASCDPRTVLAVLKGESIRGLAFQRAKAALEKAGFCVPAVEVTK